MKITIAGSFHEPGWSEVCDLANKLKSAGHTILAPNVDVTPLDSEATYVKFDGEEEKMPAELEKSFLGAMNNSDALVVCNSNQRIGFAVSYELGYAMTQIELGQTNLKKIYFKSPPIGYLFFKSNPQISVQEFARAIQTNPNYSNELRDYTERSAKLGMISYSSLEDYYEDLKRFYGKIRECEGRGILTIGIDSLLKRRIINNEYER